MQSKQKLLHVSSVFGTGLLLLAFHLLGGGSGARTVGHAGLGDINTEVPAAKARELSSDKLDALSLQEREESAQRRREQLQASSFDFLSETMAPEVVSCEESRSAAPVRTTSVSEVTRTEPARPAPASSRSRSHVMQEKRRRLQEVYGIVLPEQDTEEEAKAVPVVTGKEDRSLSTRAVKEAGTQPFHGIGDEFERSAGDIRAVVHGDQKNLAQGSMIKLRLLDPVVTGYGTVPANTLVYGKLSFASNRVMVHLESITYRNRVIPFKASVYDMDGFEGISVPENVVHDTGQEATRNVVSSTPVSIPTGVGMVTSAVNAVGSALKASVQGSVREQKISVSSNYSVILKSDI